MGITANDYRGWNKLLQLTILIKICLLESGVQKGREQKQASDLMYSDVKLAFV